MATMFQAHVLTHFLSMSLAPAAVGAYTYQHHPMSRFLPLNAFNYASSSSLTLVQLSVLAIHKVQLGRMKTIQHRSPAHQGFNHALLEPPEQLCFACQWKMALTNYIAQH